MTFKLGLLTGVLFSGLIHAAQTCSLVFDQCPGNFVSGTITVPQSVIWLDPKIPFCAENVQIQSGGTSGTPSIVFIIDNSGSMSNDQNSDANDPQQARFSVVSTLLDTINAATPGTEVGLVIYTRRLQFDDRDNPYFKPLFPGDPLQHDAYVPLTALNKTFPNGRTGLDTLKSLLKYHGKGNLDYATTRPAGRTNALYDSLNMRDGTDITLGFDAAKAAMADSKNAKSDQYFILLSDGEPSGEDDIRKARSRDFINGTNVPTTFTIFFQAGNNANPPAPQTIVDMTNNIKANGYSTSNPKSAYYAINLPGSQLLNLLQSSVINPIFTNAAAKAKSAILSAGGIDYNSASVDAQDFVFAKPVPLSADQTTIQLQYTYSYTDSGKSLTKTVPYTLTVKRSGAGALAMGLSSSCSDQADIGLFYNNQSITRVTADNTSLDVHVTLPAGQTCADCKVLAEPSKSPDKETISLTQAGGFETGNFKRETSNTPVPGDGKLQNLPTDSIVIIWTNPDNALDVVRKSFPYTDVSTALEVTNHNDVAKVDNQIPRLPGEHFVLIAPTSLNATPGSDIVKNWGVIPTLSVQDSSHYVGIGVEASRAFKVSISVFTNLGQYVNKIEFTVSQAEFDKLSKGIKNNTRVLRILWDNRAQDGSLAGTGAYILKTDVTLLKIPGIAEDQVVRSDYRIVGVLRSH